MHILRVIAMTVALLAAQDKTPSEPKVNPKPETFDTRPIARNCPTSTDDAEIYSIALQEIVFKRFDEQDNRLMLYRQTAAGVAPGLMGLAPTGAGRDFMEKVVDDETKTNFNAVCRMRCDIASGVEPRERISWMSSDETYSIFSNGKGWEDLPKKHPNVVAYVLLSQIGFNKAHNRALVYVGYSCGGLCGHGHLVLLEKKETKWAVLKSALLWMS